MSLLVRGTYHQIENVRECLKEMAAEEVRSETEITNNSILVNRVPNPAKTKPKVQYKYSLTKCNLNESGIEFVSSWREPSTTRYSSRPALMGN